MILVVVKNPIKPKYADEFPSLIAEFTQATRAEPGNVCFDWYRSVDDPNMYVLVEAFVDRAAGDLHTSTEHFQKAMGELGRYLAAVPEIVNVEVPEGWSRMSEVS
jgi:quinol monooxygenase YgiN